MNSVTTWLLGTWASRGNPNRKSVFSLVCFIVPPIPTLSEMPRAVYFFSKCLTKTQVCYNALAFWATSFDTRSRISKLGEWNVFAFYKCTTYPHFGKHEWHKKVVPTLCTHPRTKDTEMFDRRNATMPHFIRSLIACVGILSIKYIAHRTTSTQSINFTFLKNIIDWTIFIRVLFILST